MKHRSLFCLLLLPLLMFAAPPEPFVPVQNAISPCYIALTFDDGPSLETTEALLDGLKSRDARATFFLIGEQIDGAEALILRMRDEGHQIGNHTYSHVRLDRGTADALHELEKADAALGGVLGEDDYWIRPPWGFVRDAVRQKVTVPMIYWSVDTQDWSVLDADAVTCNIIQNVQDGDIVLLHDIYPTSVKAALQAIDALSAQGYQFVTVEELFARKDIVPQSGHFYVRPDAEVTW